MADALEIWNGLSRRHHEFVHRCARFCGLSDAQFWLLHGLCESERPLCQASFCERWHYSKQTVSAAVASLERGGLVSLSFAEGSRKQKELSLTEAGNAFCDRHVRRLKALEGRALAQLTESELTALFHLYGKLLGRLEEESGPVLA